MYCVIFKSKLKNSDDKDYHKMADEMLSLAKQQDGFISFEHYRSVESDERVSIIHFETENDIIAWKLHPDHQYVQKMGKQKWYEYYHVEVSKVVRSYQKNMK